MTSPLPLMTVDRLVELHRQGMELYGGASPPPRLDCLEGCIGNAEQACLYMSGSVDPLQYSGYLIYYLVQNHCALDGNKRIGWMAMMDVLRAQDFDLRATDDEAEEFVNSIVQHRRDAETAIEWIAERLMAPRP